MNMKIFRLINNLANKDMLLDKIMIFFSKNGIYMFAGILVLLFLLGIFKKDKKIRCAAVNTALFTSINLVLAYFIGILYYTDRPFVNNKVNLLYPHVKDASFPSDHATATMSISLGINKYNKVLGIILGFLSIIIGFSRIYVGHHSPFDIVGSYIIVFIMSYIYHAKLSNKINKIYDKIESVIAAKLEFTSLYK
ncbi:MAG: phosphatase PAP2 family protein [Clostridium sp.]|uniref:phosphatase PAP2 family protein n=1 Tax=Clostridium sp. TaxID=1506 RepID=UPI0039EBF338